MEPICIIPLRAGSKGLPNKNIKPLCGKPLFCWVLDTLIESKLTPHIWVATDCADVKQIVRELYPSVGVYERSAKSARDKALSDEVVLEFLKKNPQPSDAWLVLVQATSPFTSLEDFGRLFREMERNCEAQSLLACVLSKKFRWSSDGQPLDYEFGNKPLRQNYAGHWVETGAFYATKVEALLSSGRMTSAPVGVVEVGDQAHIDIDELLDFHMAEGCARHITQ